jgi:regulatory protein YycI of two-component signal transduction system YycFG
MNWGKLKNFLIGLFLIINIFLVITMITQERKNTLIPVQTINDTVSVLEKNDILVDASIIPTDVKNISEFTVIPVTKS